MSAARELQRLRYLQAMGVQVYVSRRVLEGAAPTRKLRLKNAPQKSVAQSLGGTTGSVAASKSIKSTEAAPRAGSLAPEHLRSLLRGSQPSAPERAAESSGAKNAPSDSDQSQAAPTQQAAVPRSERFRLALIVFAGRLWLEDLGDDALATQQLQLITALGRALEHPRVMDAAPRVAQFDWPLHENQQLDLGADEAAATLEGFLCRQLDENACVELICLGDPAAARVRALQLPCAKRRILSSRAMLDQPELKRDVWRELRP